MAEEHGTVWGALQMKQASVDGLSRQWDDVGGV